MQIIPAPLEKDPDSLLNQINRLSPYYKRFQVDIADGIFVHNRTVQIDDLIVYCADSQLPTTDKLMFDFHLMVQDYNEEIQKLLKLKEYLNIKNVFIHSALSPNYQLLAANYSQFSFGLVINPEETIEEFNNKYDLSTLPLLQIMSVVPGYQGQPFLPETLKKIEQLRKYNYGYKIYLDGAINDKTLPAILKPQNCPDFLCIGSFLTKTDNLQERVKYLKEAIK